MKNNHVERFISVDKIYTTYDKTRNFKAIFKIKKKADTGSLIAGSNKTKNDPLKEIIKIFIPENKYGKIQVKKKIRSLGYDAKSNIEPDYFLENLGLIFEFDGPDHYNDSIKVMKDERKYQNLKYIKKNGKNVPIRIIRIPYYFQLTKNVAKFIFKDLIIHFSKELKNLPTSGFYSDDKFKKAISKVYNNIFSGKPAETEYEIPSCGLHTSQRFPSEFTEKGIEKLLNDFDFSIETNNKLIKAPKCIEHQYMWSLKYIIDDIKTYENPEENVRLVLPTWHKKFMYKYNFNIKNKDEKLLKCLFTRDKESILKTKY